MRILIAVSDGAARALWGEAAATHGHEVLEAAPGPEAWPIVERSRPELAVIELAPDRPEALELCRLVGRADWQPRPLFLVLVPQLETDPMVAALRTGAADLVVGQPDRRTAVAHLTALERRRGSTGAAPPLAYELATSSAWPGVSEPSGDIATGSIRIEASTPGAEPLAHVDRDSGPSAALTPEGGLPARHPVTRTTVLLVDDEAAVRGPLRRALEGGGYRVVEASDGEEGLELLTALGGEIALLVVDERMPKLSGLEVLREARRRSGGLPVVLMSSRAPSAGGCGTLEADAVLLKPFQLAELTRTVQRVLTLRS